MSRNLPAAAAVALLVLSACALPALARPAVLSIYHTPDRITPDDDITVYIQVNDTSEISKPYLTHCSIEPSLCYPPVEMKPMGNNTYYARLGKLALGEWKYNITLQFKDGNLTTTTDTHFTVVPPGGNGGNGGNNNTTDNNRTGDKASASTPAYYLYIGIAVVLAAVVLAVVVLARRKRPKK